MPNSNFLVFSESFYIKRFKNKGYRYYLGREDTSPPPTNTRDSKAKRKKRFVGLLKKNNWTMAELAKHLGVSRAWVTKVLKDL
jgi:transcriptional regulator of acetoin/glycerol metabolism